MKYLILLPDDEDNYTFELGRCNSIADAYDCALAHARLMPQFTNYIRSWYNSDDRCVVIDYGSWSKFFIIKSEDGSDFEEEYVKHMDRLAQEN